MADTTPLGKLSILETVNLGLLDFARSLKAILIIAVLPALLTTLLQALLSASTSDDTSMLSTVLLALPEYVIAAPFYMALLYQISRIRHSPPTPPRDSLFAGLALFKPYMITSLMLVAMLIAAGMIILSMTAQAGEGGQPVIGLAGLIGALFIALATLALSFYPLFILFDQHTGIEALKDSLTLFRSHWRRIMAVLIFPVMLVLMMQSLLLQLLGFGNVAAGEAPPTPGFLAILIIQLFSWIILGVFESVRLLLFQDLRARVAS